MSRTGSILLLLATCSAAQGNSEFKKICPAPSELEWMKIGWEPSLWAGVVDAHALKKPILLWTMNGHPLGHT